MSFVKIVLLCALCVNFSSAKPVANYDWWKTAIFYQIYPRSFKDSNNDGIGDLQGVISKLDHFVDAGINGIWLSPIYKSPQVDQGYDISDFRDVDPIFGNLDDFKELLEKAHKKGLKVILDFVPNHSSDLHEWFKKSVDKEEGYENYYVWLDGRENNTKPPNNWISYFHGSAWEYSPVRKQWYLHQFAIGQPDLNYRDQKLVNEMRDVLTYWLDMGVDGFRVDTIPSLFERGDFPDEPLSGDPTATPNDHEYLLHPYENDQPETFDMVYQCRRFLDHYTETHGGDARIMMTEVWSDVDKLFGYYGNETWNGAHFTFNFFFISRLNSQSTASDIKFVIDDWYEKMPKRFTANWVLGNHDRNRVSSRYGASRIDGLEMIEMLLPGVAITYNGEEIGMEDGEVTWEQGYDPQACNGAVEDFAKNSRDFERTPYQWDNSTNAGFNEGQEPWLPVSQKYKQTNLAAQKQTWSHYRIYQSLVKLRQTETFKKGALQTAALNENVLVIVRRMKEDRSFVLVVNIGDKQEEVNLQPLNLVGNLLVEIPSVNSFRVKGTQIDASKVTLIPFESLVLVL